MPVVFTWETGRVTYRMGVIPRIGETVELVAYVGVVRNVRYDVARETVYIELDPLTKG